MGWLFVSTISRDLQKAWNSKFAYDKYVVGGRYDCSFSFLHFFLKNTKNLIFCIDAMSWDLQRSQFPTLQAKSMFQSRCTSVFFIFFVFIQKMWKIQRLHRCEFACTAIFNCAVKSGSCAENHSDDLSPYLYRLTSLTCSVSWQNANTQNANYTFSCIMQNANSYEMSDNIISKYWTS